MPTEQEMVADGWVRLGREGDRLTTVARKAFGQWLSWRVRDAAGAVWAQPRPEYLQAPTPLFSLLRSQSLTFDASPEAMRTQPK